MFRSADVVAEFVAELARSTARFQCIVPIYCFMPDHLHVILKGLGPGSRPKLAIERFKHQTGNWLKQNAPEFSWQDDFYDHIIRKGEDVDAQIQYVAANPVRAGLALDLFAYPYTGSIGCDLREVFLSAL